MISLRNAGKPTDVSSRAGTFWQRAADRPLWTVFLLALLVRALNLALLEGNSAFFAEEDTIAYWKLGAKLATPGEFWPALLSTTDRMPLYPLLLAGIRSAFGDLPRMVAAVQAVIDAGTCALIAAMGAAISQRVGLIAGILAALSVTLVVFSTQILTDSVFLFFFTLMLYAGARFLLHPTPALAAAAGIAGGLALATRPALGLLLAAAVPVVFLVALVKRKSFVSAGAATLLFAIAAAAPIAPVLLRNAIRYDSAALMSQTGDYLAFWIVPLVAERADGTPYQASVDRMDALYRQALARSDASALNNPFVQSALKAELAREEMARLPARAFAAAWLEGAVVNLGAPALLADPRVRALPKPSFYNTPGTGLWQKARAYLLDDPGRYQLLLVAGLVAMVPFLALEAVGFVMLARSLPWAAVLAGSVLAYFLLIGGPVATPKYRLPMEPVLIVLAAIPLARLLEPKP
jgi:4-amino-4-deoxy-L-arabinose transferase-like glycosyltransferase